jgi:diguanylate cyclase (GGDEF)-like protein
MTDVPSPEVPSPLEQGFINNAEISDNSVAVDVSYLLNPENPAMKLFARTQEMAGPMGATAIEKERLSETDQLTGLLNRRGLMHRLNHILEDPDFDPERWLLMFADLKLFKDINDFFGHDEGDSILREIGKILKVRKGDIVARYGGDEIVIVVDRKQEAVERRLGPRDDVPRRETQDSDDAKAKIIDGFSKRLSSDVLVAGMNARQKWLNSEDYHEGIEEYYSIGVNIGAVVLDPTQTAEENIKLADQRMYENKRDSGYTNRRS